MLLGSEFLIRVPKIEKSLLISGIYCIISTSEYLSDLSAPKSQRFLRFAIAMPIADLKNRSDSRQEKAMLHCDLRVRWKVASDLRFRAAISEPQNPFFLRDFWRFGSVNAEIASDCDCAILVR